MCVEGLVPRLCSYWKVVETLRDDISGRDLRVMKNAFQ